MTDYKKELQRIGQAIGYGASQQILADLWDNMLKESYGVSGGRGQMGVTIDDNLPPLPQPASRRKVPKQFGGYNMVPAYSVEEVQAYARSAQQKLRDSESKLESELEPKPEPESEPKSTLGIDDQTVANLQQCVDSNNCKCECVVKLDHVWESVVLGNKMRKVCQTCGLTIDQHDTLLNDDEQHGF
jgi:hypothetical protein